MTATELREIRTNLQLSQTEMTAWLGASVAQLRAYQYWESGERKVPAYVAEIIRLKSGLAPQQNTPDLRY